MIGVAILGAVLALLLLGAAVRIFRRGRALRVRGVTVTGECVNVGAPSHGTLFVQVRFPAEGSQWVVPVGPFEFPPARVGESMAVVYDPHNLENVEVPEKITDGRFTMIVMVFASVMLVASLATLAFG
ncbi:hypothetical protein ACWFRJ_21070 [Streptomyces sp. NPDC055239]